ncbi:hypothetical protein CTAYLR_000049 [Chrysophaeum taylorii]|uniref:Uncharacterized protein n=1 Tax=Chrysophaeum taylorii TaxID=2483200 RepID=A0AAD7XM43_9STRA|nr:hypothetical protein CTAYLR_000049 [Chrysophaeum taylorii]
MTLASGLFGAFVGLGLQFSSNTIRKLHLWRRPWEHLVLVGIGAWCGHNYPRWEDELLDSVNRMRVDRKLPPLKKAFWGVQVTTQGPPEE